MLTQKTSRMKTLMLAAGGFGLILLTACVGSNLRMHYVTKAGDTSGMDCPGDGGLGGPLQVRWDVVSMVNRTAPGCQGMGEQANALRYAC